MDVVGEEENEEVAAEVDATVSGAVATEACERVRVIKKLSS